MDGVGMGRERKGKRKACPWPPLAALSYVKVEVEVDVEY